MQHHLSNQVVADIAGVANFSQGLIELSTFLV